MTLKKRNFAWIVCVLFVVPHLLKAQETLLLSDVLNRVAEKNLTLAAESQQVRVLQAGVLQAKEFPNPSVSTLISKIPMQEPIDNGIAQDYTFQQTLPIFGKRKLQKKAALGDLGTEEAKYEMLKLEILRQAKETYWNYSVAYSQVLFAAQNLKFQQNFLSRVQENFQSGQANMADVTRAKVEVARSFSNVYETKKKMEEAKSQLNRLMGEEIHQELSPPEILKEIRFSFDENQLIAEARQHRPERLGILKLQEGSEAKVKLAKRLLWAPDLTTQFVYQKNERNNDSLDSLGAGVGLVFPLWNHYKGERVSAQAGFDFAREQQKDVEQQITLEVHQAILNFNLSKEQLNLWKEAVDQATESARLAEQRYLEGDVDLSVFFQARRDLVGTTQEYLNALRDYHVNIAGLERAVAKNLLEKS